MVKCQDLPLTIQADYHVIVLIIESILRKVQLFAFALDLDANGVVNQLALLEIVNKEPVPKGAVVLETYEDLSLC